MTTAIAVEDLRKSFGDLEAVRGVGFEVEALEVFTVFALGMIVLGIAIWEFNAGE